jgi:carbamoyltransferase
MYEEALSHLLNSVYAKYNCKNLVLAGGCAMNSVANGRITTITPFENVYIQSAAGDAGGAVGAAFVAASEIDGRNPERGQMLHAFWGPDFSDDTMSTMLASRRSELDSTNCEITSMDDDDVLCGIVRGEWSGGPEHSEIAPFFAIHVART